MSSIIIEEPLNNNDIKKFKKHSEKNKSEKTYNLENKENIQNNIQPKKLFEEEEESSKKLNIIKDKEKIIQKKKPKNISKKEYEIIQQKIKENTMRNEVDKIYHETERLKQEYEEKNSNYFLFSHPQFIKFLKKVEMQLYFLLSLVILLGIFSILMLNNTNKSFEVFSILCLVISVLSFSNTIHLIAFVKIGLLNDSALSRAFRFFVFLESILLIISFCFNFSSLFMIKSKNIKKNTPLKFLIIMFFLLIIIDLIFVIKKSLNLFFETYLILLGKKTEYSTLISKENDLSNKESTLFNLKTSLNNEELDKTNSNFLSDNNSMIKFNDKKEKIMKNYFPYNNFHYSVTSERKNDYNLNYFNYK